MSAAQAITGEDLMGEVFDLLCTRLPELAVDDPMRPRLASLVPAMGSALGRPTVRPVAAPQPAERGR